MNTKQFFSVVALAVVLAIMGNVFFGRYLSAKISTLPLINKWQLLAPQTPIVINNHEVVRVEGSADFMDAANSGKSKLALLISGTGADARVVAGAVNMTSDGLIVAPLEAVSGSNKIASVLFSDGRSGQIASVAPDPATGIAFIKVNISNLPSAALATSKNIQIGERVVVLENSLQANMARLTASFITRSQADTAGSVFTAGNPERSFSIQASSELIDGSAIVNLKGEVVGFWNGKKLISSDVIRQSLGLYLSSNAKVVRPVFSFTYRMIGKTEAVLRGMVAGAEVVTAVKAKTQLLTGDVITDVDGTGISGENSLEEILEKYKPGDTVKFTVVRASASQTVSITVQ